MEPVSKKTKILSQDRIMEIIKTFVLLENKSEVSRRLEVPLQNVMRVLKNHRETVERLKKNRDEMLEHDLTKLIEQGVERLKNTISTASPKDAVIILGTCYDKRQLIRGGPTQAISIHDEKELSRRLSQRLGLMLMPQADTARVENEQDAG